MEGTYKFSPSKSTKQVGATVVDLQSVYFSFTTATLWLEGNGLPIDLGFCVRFMNENKERIGTAEFCPTLKERTFQGKTVRGYSLKKLEPPDMESFLPTISLTTLAIPLMELT